MVVQLNQDSQVYLAGLCGAGLLAAELSAALDAGIAGGIAVTVADAADAVDGEIDILLDGGIRRGTDIVKALALGAKGVLVGRPIIWGLTYAGEQGVQQILEILKIEFDNARALCGCRDVIEITSDLIL